MKLRKDDPIFYRNIINDLVIQALNEGLEVIGSVSSEGIEISFKAKNGDTAGITFKKS